MCCFVNLYVLELHVLYALFKHNNANKLLCAWRHNMLPPPAS